MASSVECTEQPSVYISKTLGGACMQGINAAHEDFLSTDGTATRILTGFSLDGATPESDCNGHGSHISGTAAGRYFGVAKNAFIHPCTLPNSMNSIAPSAKEMRACFWQKYGWPLHVQCSMFLCADSAVNVWMIKLILNMAFLA